MAARKPLRQQIRYVKAADGTRLAWAQAGEGPVVVKAANWLTHLEYEWESPVWQHWLRFFAGNFRFVRYDERGCGMSEWRDSELTARVWTDDLEAVIDAAEPKEPVTLLGISQGSVASIGYALRHPERVSRLILYGGYARGPFLRGNPEAEATFRAVIELARVAWASDNPTFRQVFTS
jgi:pimeloyl-ACP methyl ester carboxylesterase